MNSHTHRQNFRTHHVLSCLLGFLLFALPIDMHAQLGLLRKLGKMGSKAGKVGKAGRLGRMGRPVKAIASGAGLFYADDMLRYSTSQLDEMVGIISRKGDDLSFRSNFKSTEGMNLAEVTIMNADEGLKGMVKRHVEIRGADTKLTDDIFTEAFQSGMEFVVDAALLEEDEFAEYELMSLPGLKVRCSDGWARPLIEKGEKKLLAFHQDFPVYVPLENQHLFTILAPLNTLIIDPAELEFQSIDSTVQLPNVDTSLGEVYFDDLLKEWVGAEAWWELSNEDDQLLATQYTSAGSVYAIELPESWIMTADMMLRQNPKLKDDPPFISILSIILIMIIGLWGLMKLFQKTGRHGIEGMVPVYNHYRMFEMAGMEGKQILWLLVPFYNIYVYYQFTEKFATNFALSQKWLHVLGTVLPPLLWAYIGFKKNVYYRGPEGTDLYMFEEE
ncbi:MAG: DUF5684 domain-containing protein [Bacteroidota bacterium]